MPIGKRTHGACPGSTWIGGAGVLATHFPLPLGVDGRARRGDAAFVGLEAGTRRKAFLSSSICGLGALWTLDLCAGEVKSGEGRWSVDTAG